ncbi:hypothetical protein SAMN05216288_2944 [Pseudomonas punonensis]|uniref:Uncharacterized protein n=1 Tax=Phytopseudomonas punonensis TaxID=1220495 RepID=A0A1M7FPW9_9GAMM|nr:hypothetical protein SAMN05216288_2944 [Pseudomonas punonensis]
MILLLRVATFIGGMEEIVLTIVGLINWLKLDLLSYSG